MQQLAEGKRGDEVDDLTVSIPPWSYFIVTFTCAIRSSIIVCPNHTLLGRLISSSREQKNSCSIYNTSPEGQHIMIMVRTPPKRKLQFLNDDSISNDNPICNNIWVTIQPTLTDIVRGLRRACNNWFRIFTTKLMPPFIFGYEFVRADLSHQIPSVEFIIVA